MGVLTCKMGMTRRVLRESSKVKRVKFLAQSQRLTLSSLSSSLLLGNLQAVACLGPTSFKVKEEERSTQPALGELLTSHRLSPGPRLPRHADSLAKLLNFPKG